MVRRGWARSVASRTGCVIRFESTLKRRSEEKVMRESEDDTIPSPPYVAIFWPRTYEGGYGQESSIIEMGSEKADAQRIIY